MSRMTIKRILEALLLSLFLPCMAANAADTTITITGNIKASPCVIQNSAVTLELGDFFMDSSADTSSFKTLILTLTNCPTGTANVTATFSGEVATITQAPAFHYKNSGTAAGVVVDLQDNTGAGRGNGTTMKVSVVSSTATFNLRSRMYIPVRANLTVGTVSVPVAVTFTYS